MFVILAAILDFSKILFCVKLQQILLKLVENTCLQPQKEQSLKEEIRTNFPQILQFSIST